MPSPHISFSSFLITDLSIIQGPSAILRRAGSYPALWYCQQIMCRTQILHFKSQGSRPTLASIVFSISFWVNAWHLQKGICTQLASCSFQLGAEWIIWRTGGRRTASLRRDVAVDVEGRRGFCSSSSFGSLSTSEIIVIVKERWASRSLPGDKKRRNFLVSPFSRPDLPTLSLLLLFLNTVMEPNSPKKIQFAVPLFQSPIDSQAAEQVSWFYLHCLWKRIKIVKGTVFPNLEAGVQLCRSSWIP